MAKTLSGFCILKKVRERHLLHLIRETEFIADSSEIRIFKKKHRTALIFSF